MLKHPNISKPSEMPFQFHLKQQNLIPIYVLEDNIKQNFSKIQLFVQNQNSHNTFIDSNLNQTNSNLSKIDLKYTTQLKHMQTSIFSQIKTQIEATVTLVLNKQLATILDKILQNQSKQVEKQDQMKKHLSELKKKLKYQIAQQNQKYFTKQITKIQKDIDKKIQTTINDKTHLFSTKAIGPNTNSKFNKKQQTQQKQKQKPQQFPQNTHGSSNNHSQNQQTQQNTLFESQTRQSLEELKENMEELTEFRTQFDKRFTENFNSLKGSWKDLGSQLLDNKKVLNKKFQELSIDIIKLKNIAEFKPLPQTTDEPFKKKILQKFTDFYKLISSLTTKTQFEMVNERNKTTIHRFSQQVIGLREQFQKNTEYFTFYMNNSNSDDLNQAINKLKGDILQDKKYVDSMLGDILKHADQRKSSIQNIVKSLGALEMTNQTFQGKIQKIFLNIQRFDDKIKSLEDMNEIDPFKMKKIHDSLDLQLSFPHQQASSPKANSMQLKIVKELKKEIQLLKDNVFVLASERNMNGITQQDDLLELKNQIKIMKQRFEKLRIDNDQAQLSRKPWIVTNSNNDRHKSVTKQPTLQKDQSKKKISLEIGKGGGFINNRNSEKNIVYNIMNTTPDEKFQVYEKYREKYLSDTLKLPQIFKEKLNSDEFFK